jgi:hypothetical protein
MTAMSLRTSPIVLAAFAFFPLFSACNSEMAPTRAALVAKYPTVEQGSARPEDKRVMCPFQRLLQRSGIYDAEVLPQTTLTVPTQSVTDASREFGCASSSCGPVATLVDNGQPGVGVDLISLHQASGISHQCGLTFAPGGSEVSDAVRDSTLARLQTLADANGHLSFSNLMTVKREICTAQGITMGPIERVEVKLIYAYLAGVENGYILLSDVDRLFHATMPVNKTSSWVDSTLLAKVR